MKEEAAQLPDERKPLRNPLDEPTPEEIQVAKDDMRELFNERHGISNKPLAEPPEPLPLEPVQAPDWVRATNAMHRELVELRSEIDLLKAPPDDEFIDNGLEFPGDADSSNRHIPFWCTLSGANNATCAVNPGWVFIHGAQRTKYAGGSTTLAGASSCWVSIKYTFGGGGAGILLDVTAAAVSAPPSSTAAALYWPLRFYEKTAAGIWHLPAADGEGIQWPGGHISLGAPLL